MTNLDRTVLRLTVQTPTVIGDGTKYDPYSYVQSDGRLLVIDVSRLMEEICRKNLADDYARVVELGESIDSFLRDQGIRARDVALYEIELGSPGIFSATKPRGRGPEVLKTMRGQDHMPYIPGSSLKGSVRTAILYRLVGRTRRDILERAHRRGSPRVAARDIERLLRGKKDDPQYDILRFLSVEDSEPMNHDDVRVYEVNLSGTKKPTIFVEALKPGTTVLSSLSIATRETALKELGLQERKELLSQSYLLQAFHAFSRDLLDHEREFYSRKGETDLVRQVETLTARNESSAPLVRTGWGQGFLSTTVSLLTKKMNTKAYEKIARMVQRPRRPGDFPRTRKLARTGVRDYVPLGWVKLEVVS